MAKKSLIFAPHPDDELLGVGGTILKRKSMGNEVAVVYVTEIEKGVKWSSDDAAIQKDQVHSVCESINFDRVYFCSFPSTKLDELSFSSIIDKFSYFIADFKPNEIFVPHFSDIHSDHKIVYNAAISCTKVFRYPFIQSVLAYETLSETDFSMMPDLNFMPNYFVNISNFLDSKIENLKLYQSELDEFPFPRSIDAIEALAKVRGVAAGFTAAEAFQLLKATEE